MMWDFRWPLPRPLSLCYFQDWNSCNWSHSYQKSGPKASVLGWNPRLAVKAYLLASPCWAQSGGPRLRYRLSELLLLIDRNSGSEDQLLSHQHFTDSCDTWQGRRTTSAWKGKKNKCARQARHEISGDKADQCKAGGELPAAVCKLIIVLSGPVSLTWQMFQLPLVWLTLLVQSSVFVSFTCSHAVTSC